MSMPWDLSEWVQTVRPEQLPADPFKLTPDRMVVDRGRWLAQIQAEARRPKSPRRITLQADIKRIYELVEGS